MLLNYPRLFSFFFSFFLALFSFSIFFCKFCGSSTCMRPSTPPSNRKLQCDCNQNEKKIVFLFEHMHFIASNGGGMGSISTTSSQQSFANQSPVGGDPPSNPSLTASSVGDKNQKSQTEFNFQTIHEAFGREIEQDLKERRRLKELATQPLIQF